MRSFLDRNDSKLASVFATYILKDYKLVWHGGFPSTDFEFWTKKLGSFVPETFKLPESKALGPYSPGVIADSFIYLSGQLGMRNGKMGLNIEE